MRKMDLQDMIGGILLIAVGVGAMLYAIQVLNIGTLRRMGSGAFPLMAGALVALTGVAILLPALFREGPKIQIDLRSLACMLAAVLVFALTIRSLGLIPAVFAATFIASRSDSRLSLLGTLVVATVLSALALLVFRLGLKLQAPLFAWSW